MIYLYSDICTLIGLDLVLIGRNCNCSLARYKNYYFLIVFPITTFQTQFLKFLLEFLYLFHIFFLWGMNHRLLYLLWTKLMHILIVSVSQSIIYTYINMDLILISSVQSLSHFLKSDFLWPHGLQHARPPCPSPTPEPTQTHVHWINDAIQPSHPLSSPSPPAPNPSQHQGLFQWVSSSHQVAKVLELQFQHQSFQWIFIGTFPICIYFLICV